ncbi:MAG: hypothetical protein KDA71_01580 [Planctomycetales bacterium]|nr:hypothetical protein [Planctomycetales bacterium]
MNLQLPSEFDQFVRGLVADGRSVSAEAAVVEGVRLLMSQEKLRGEVQRGLDDINQGKWVSEEEVFGEVDAAIDAIEHGSLDH